MERRKKKRETLHLSLETPSSFSTSSKRTFACFLFCSTPSAPIDIRFAIAQGSVVPPKLIGISGITDTTQYWKILKNIILLLYYNYLLGTLSRIIIIVFLPVLVFLALWPVPAQLS